MIDIRLRELPEIKGHGFYRSAGVTGVSHIRRTRLKAGKAEGIDFDTLESKCVAV